MPKPRDHARVHTDIWGDDDWLDLGVEAQMLYLTLYTSPLLSLCGAGEWHPGKLCNRSQGWTRDRIEAAAQELSERLFVIIDTETDEFLIRSWIKHDGLWRTPNMAVSVVNARADLASRTLRGVIVHEVRKLRDSEPKSSSWDKDAVKKMLTQQAVEAADLVPFNGGFDGASNGGRNSGSNGASKGYGDIGSKGGSNGVPTTATAVLTTATTKSSLHRERTEPRPIPDDWAPNVVHRAKLNKLPSGIDLDFEAEQFRNHALTHDRRLANWDAAFHTWLGRAKPRDDRPGVGAATTKAQGWLDIANSAADHNDQRALG